MAITWIINVRQRRMFRIGLVVAGVYSVEK